MFVCWLYPAEQGSGRISHLAFPVPSQYVTGHWQGQAGQGLGQPGMVEGVPACGREMGLDEL